MKGDPKIRRDGRCANRKCRREVVIKMREGVNPALYADPFCSSECARAWHGVALASLQTGRPGGYYSDMRKND